MAGQADSRSVISWNIAHREAESQEVGGEVSSPPAEMIHLLVSNFTGFES